MHVGNTAAGHAAEPESSFRDRLVTFLDRHHPGTPPRRSRTARIGWQRAWSATLFDHGFAGPAWPVEFGGMRLSLAQQVIYHDEYGRRRLPAHPGNGPLVAGPTIIRYGTAEQHRRYLPAMLRGDQIWAQGFSEPEAGSDLPSLRTTARRTGDVYVVDGQKIWSSYADVADMMFALVRTGSQTHGADGISYLLIDMRSPGITVAPIRDMTGQQRFCEVRFEAVQVPAENLVGEEHRGWEIARTTLGHERAARSLSQAADARRRFLAFVELGRQRGITGNPLVRDRLAAMEVRLRVLWLNAIRTVARLERSGEPGPMSSLARLDQSTAERQLFELAVDLVGPAALITGGPDAVEGGRWARGLLITRGSTIGAGTAEIQRNTIAERVLKLPRA